MPKNETAVPVDVEEIVEEAAATAPEENSIFTWMNAAKVVGGFAICAAAAYVGYRVGLDTVMSTAATTIETTTEALS